MWPFFIVEYVIFFLLLSHCNFQEAIAGLLAACLCAWVCTCISTGADLHERKQWKSSIFNVGNLRRDCFVSSLKSFGIWLFQTISKHILWDTHTQKPPPLFPNKVIPSVVIAWGGDKVWRWPNMTWKNSLLMRNHLYDSFLVFLIFICGFFFFFPLTNTYSSLSFLC